jgi:hypothetical protein
MCVVHTRCMPKTHSADSDVDSSCKNSDSSESLNVCVVIGEVLTEAITTVLADGREVANFDLATYTEERRTIVPVVITNSAVIPAVGDEICAVGFVRKRFSVRALPSRVGRK